MFDMTLDTLKLVVENKLFADQTIVFRQVAIGIAGTTAGLVALAALTPAPLWLAAIVAGAAGGYAMPYLLRDIKFQ